MAVTIGDIARQLGLSVATVSKALNGRSDVSAETRQRVCDVARELNYYPSAAARNLRRQRTDKVGLVLPHPVIYTADYVAELITGAALAAERHGQALVVYTSNANDPSRLAAICRAREVDGLLLRGLPDFRATAAVLNAEGMPYVVLGRRVDAPTASYIAPDNIVGSLALMRHLLARGHTRIGFTTRPELAESSADRFHGYRLALTEAGIPFDPALVVETVIEPESGYKAAITLLDLPHPPTAIFAVHDLVALDALRAARERGLRVPDDLAVAGFDGVHAALVTEPPLTTVRQPLREMGQEAVEMVLARVGAPATEAVVRRTVSVQLVVRASTGGERGGESERFDGWQVWGTRDAASERTKT